MTPFEGGMEGGREGWFQTRCRLHRKLKGMVADEGDEGHDEGRCVKEGRDVY